MKNLLILFFVSFSFAQPSRIELKSHFSPTLSTNKEFNIFFPEGYDSESDHYPVVYLFRGAVDEWADPNEDNARRGNIKTVFDSLYAKKKIGKMILIMPGLGAPASQNEYNYLVDDLVPYIDANYRTIPSRWHRAMDGFSLGGLTVTNLLAGAPQFFVSVGSYDGTLSLFDNAKFSNANSSLIYAIKQIQLLYHTASVGGNNASNNQATFNILNAKGIVNSLPSFLLDPNAQHNWFYADWHTAITLPLHWQKILSAHNSLNLALKTQLAGQTISGTGPIEWSRHVVPNTLSTNLFYSRNDGKTWTKFYSTTGNDSSVQWNTTSLSDGTRYKVRIISAGDTLFGSSVSGTFTVNNPGNGAPDVEFIDLNENDTISGNYNLRWSAADAEGDILTIALHISYNGGVSWSNIASNIPNSGNYFFDTKDLPNGNAVSFRISCSDGSITTQTVSPTLIMFNKRINLLNASFDHKSGHSDAIFKALAMSGDSLRDANYYIVFKESPGKKTYSVINTKGVEVVKDAVELDGKTEGPLFNGFRFLIQDFPVPVVNSELSGWIACTSALSAEIKLIDINTQAGTVAAQPFASDYEIRIGNSVIDTTLSLYGAVAQPIAFTVWNTTKNRKTKMIFVELDGNGIISRNDEIYLIERDSLNDQILSWHLQFVGNETAANPLSGDIFRIKVMKPLTQEDFYQFIYYPPLSAGNENNLPQQFSLSQNYPNPFNPTTNIGFSIPASDIVSLKIFDILGREVKTLLNKKMSAGTHTIEWNAENNPTGLYFYRLQSGNFILTKKMLLLK